MLHIIRLIIISALVVFGGCSGAEVGDFQKNDPDPEFVLFEIFDDYPALKEMYDNIDGDAFNEILNDTMNNLTHEFSVFSRLMADIMEHPRHPLQDMIQDIKSLLSWMLNGDTAYFVKNGVDQFYTEPGDDLVNSFISLLEVLRESPHGSVMKESLKVQRKVLSYVNNKEPDELLEFMDELAVTLQDLSREDMIDFSDILGNLLIGADYPMWVENNDTLITGYSDMPSGKNTDLGNTVKGLHSILTGALKLIGDETIWGIQSETLKETGALFSAQTDFTSKGIADVLIDLVKNIEDYYTAWGAQHAGIYAETDGDIYASTELKNTLKELWPALQKLIIRAKSSGEGADTPDYAIISDSQGRSPIEIFLEGLNRLGLEYDSMDLDRDAMNMVLYDGFGRKRINADGTPNPSASDVPYIDHTIFTLIASSTFGFQDAYVTGGSDEDGSVYPNGNYGHGHGTPTGGMITLNDCLIVQGTYEATLGLQTYTLAFEKNQNEDDECPGKMTFRSKDRFTASNADDYRFYLKPQYPANCLLSGQSIGDGGLPNGGAPVKNNGIEGEAYSFINYWPYSSNGNGDQNVSRWTMGWISRICWEGEGPYYYADPDASSITIDGKEYKKYLRPDGHVYAYVHKENPSNAGTWDFIYPEDAPYDGEGDVPQLILAEPNLAEFTTDGRRYDVDFGSMYGLADKVKLTFRDGTTDSDKAFLSETPYYHNSDLYWDVWNSDMKNWIESLGLDLSVDTVGGNGGQLKISNLNNPILVVNECNTGVYTNLYNFIWGNGTYSSASKHSVYVPKSKYYVSQDSDVKIKVDDSSEVTVHFGAGETLTKAQLMQKLSLVINDGENRVKIQNMGTESILVKDEIIAEGGSGTSVSATVANYPLDNGSVSLHVGGNLLSTQIDGSGNITGELISGTGSVNFTTGEISFTLVSRDSSYDPENTGYPIDLSGEVKCSYSYTPANFDPVYVLSDTRDQFGNSQNSSAFEEYVKNEAPKVAGLKIVSDTSDKKDPVKGKIRITNMGGTAISEIFGIDNLDVGESYTVRSGRGNRYRERWHTDYYLFKVDGKNYAPGNWQGSGGSSFPSNCFWYNERIPEKSKARECASFEEAMYKNYQYLIGEKKIVYVIPIVLWHKVLGLARLGYIVNVKVEANGIAGIGTARKYSSHIEDNGVWIKRGKDTSASTGTEGNYKGDSFIPMDGRVDADIVEIANPLGMAPPEEIYHALGNGPVLPGIIGYNMAPVERMAFMMGTNVQRTTQPGTGLESTREWLEIPSEDSGPGGPFWEERVRTFPIIAALIGTLHSHGYYDRTGEPAHDYNSGGAHKNPLKLMTDGLLPALAKPMYYYQKSGQNPVNAWKPRLSSEGTAFPGSGWFNSMDEYFRPPITQEFQWICGSELNTIQRYMPAPVRSLAGMLFESGTKKGDGIVSLMSKTGLTTLTLKLLDRLGSPGLADAREKIFYGLEQIITSVKSTKGDVLEKGYCSPGYGPWQFASEAGIVDGDMTYSGVRSEDMVLDSGLEDLIDDFLAVYPDAGQSEEDEGLYVSGRTVRGVLDKTVVREGSLVIKIDGSAIDAADSGGIITGGALSGNGTVDYVEGDILFTLKNDPGSARVTVDYGFDQDFQTIHDAVDTAEEFLSEGSPYYIVDDLLSVMDISRKQQFSDSEIKGALYTLGKVFSYHNDSQWIFQGQEGFDFVYCLIKSYFPVMHGVIDDGTGDNYRAMLTMMIDSVKEGGLMEFLIDEVEIPSYTVSEILDDVYLFMDSEAVKEADSAMWTQLPSLLRDMADAVTASSEIDLDELYRDYGFQNNSYFE